MTDDRILVSALDFGAAVLMLEVAMRAVFSAEGSKEELRRMLTDVVGDVGPEVVERMAWPALSERLQRAVRAAPRQQIENRSAGGAKGGDGPVLVIQPGAFTFNQPPRGPVRVERDAATGEVRLVPE